MLVSENGSESRLQSISRRELSAVRLVILVGIDFNDFLDTHKWVILAVPQPSVASAVETEKSLRANPLMDMNSSKNALWRGSMAGSSGHQCVLHPPSIVASHRQAMPRFRGLLMHPPWNTLLHMAGRGRCAQGRTPGLQSDCRPTRLVPGICCNA